MSRAGRLSGDQVKVQMLPDEAAHPGDQSSGQSVLQLLLAATFRNNDMVNIWDFLPFVAWDGLVAIERQTVFDAARDVVNSNRRDLSESGDRRLYGTRRLQIVDYGRRSAQQQ